jgi:hypothetical protein
MFATKVSTLVPHAGKLAAVAAMLALGGCVVAPVGPYEVGNPTVYSADGVAYGGGPYYSAPYGYYPYAAPYYWGPSLSLGFYGGWGGGHGYRPGPGRPGWGNGRPPGMGGGGGGGWGGGHGGGGGRR